MNGDDHTLIHAAASVGYEAKTINDAQRVRLETRPLVPKVPAVLHVPFDVWVLIVKHGRTTWRKPRHVITRLLRVCRAFNSLFEFFIYDKLQLVGPHTQIREDVIMSGWDETQMIYILQHLQLDYIRYTVADLTISRWGCPQIPHVTPPEDHSIHRVFFSYILSLLVTFPRLTILHLTGVELSISDLRIIQDLGELETIYFEDVTIRAYGLGREELHRVHRLSPVRVVVHNLGWYGDISAAPIINFSRVRTITTNSAAFTEAAALWAEEFKTPLPFVDICLNPAPRDYKHAFHSHLNNEMYSRQQIKNAVNKVVQQCPRALRLKLPYWLDDGIDSLEFACPLLHAFYGSVTLAHTALRNPILREITMWSNVYTQEEAVAELRHLVRWLLYEGLELPRILIYRAYSFKMPVLNVLQELSPVMRDVRYMDLDLSETNETYPYDFCQIFRQYGAFLPLLEYFSFGSFYTANFEYSAFKSYNCWVMPRFDDWRKICPTLNCVKFGELAQWELMPDLTWKPKFLPWELTEEVVLPRFEEPSFSSFSSSDEDMFVDDGS